MVTDRVLSPALIAELTDIVGARDVITGADQRASYEVDWTGRFRGATPAVVRPSDTAQVAAIVALCRRDGVAIVAQGGNTGLVAGGVPMAGELVLSLRRIDAVGEVDVAARQITAGAGATLAAVRNAAAAAGLAYAI